MMTTFEKRHKTQQSVRTSYVLDELDGCLVFCHEECMTGVDT